MALFSTYPYNNFQSANSKECIALDKGAKKDFHPKTRFDIIPGNSDAFSAEMKIYSTQFGFGSLLNDPSNRDVDAADANVITYKQPINMIKTWNKMTDNISAKSASNFLRHLQLDNFCYQENGRIFCSMWQSWNSFSTYQNLQEIHGTLEIRHLCPSFHSTVDSRCSSHNQDSRFVPVD
jgi:hypothetical protein